MPYPLLDAHISPLRQRLIDDMTLRRFGQETQRNYMHDVGRLATFLGRGPDTAETDDLRQFQVRSRKTAPRSDHEQHRVGPALLLHPHGRPPDLPRRLVRLSRPRKLPCGPEPRRRYPSTQRHYPLQAPGRAIGRLWLRAARRRERPIAFD